MSASSKPRRADYCVVACAEIYRGDGEILANPTVGTIPFIGARLARASFEPDLVLTDGEALLVANNLPLGVDGTAKVIEGWLPYRQSFDVVWAGRRHVVMGASQVGRNGDTNISSIGPFEKPRAQLLGPRGAPGNTVNHQTSYWVPKHSRRVFVEEVDFVSGLGPSRATRLGGPPATYNDIRFVVSDLCVMDFKDSAGCARVVSLHPGVSLDEVKENTGFALTADPHPPLTREPSEAEMRLIEEFDPKGLRYREIPTERAGF
ncbi:MAG: CoA-transferase [Candidatus Nephthysia bennettiae]|uniref:CoA-transferase n=1 Tax=Candidatus Nephthysia bennettiae TaxID=3127016 RepID=A0A934KC47_9BACT|nr:CoA-transferase [Candidatus Dormibacteraeota bacterium]MBJ7614038.1 CoA-transferase [Candidatus Dormibacteraeota bacterium]PZR90120.1 MAG: CoA-transferase [Candidatus Dormibacteraeota bacterium]